ncbi:M1 family metallopeptidase [Streptomyces sp. AK02-01A]|uniref:M1 family metallopeptidase n=1 Tax=Streptomyces sp. AK02-01A TaxID=3028648 RepID=UPI0029A6BA4E|nr:M1 family metallopeptidase [Streptomyces sp. AK02-01A]MDX3853712.1 M1 family metallopeptidase [Streptomyces sp. AK02-01A]
MRYRTRVTAPTAALLGAAAVPVLAPIARARSADEDGTTDGTPGEEGLGDPVYPRLGNSGYRVSAYRLDLTYRPGTKLVDASVTISAYATKDLSRFSLDSVGLGIHGVWVGGRKAAFEQRPDKLVVTPAARIENRAKLVVRIDYTADPRKLRAPDNGWVPTPDGFAVAAQPDLARTVFPCNDHPSDKADFRFRITVPKGLTAAANGSLVSTRRAKNGTTTFVYRSRDPIATELVQITVGDYRLTERRGPGGMPLRDVVPRGRAKALEPALALTPGQLLWLERRLGRFPFETYGLLPANTDDPAAFDFTGLETQTLTLYKPGFLLQKESQIAPHMVHELVHSWFGNMVSPATWADLWLDEGHADYYALLYRYERGWPDSLGLATMEARMKDVYSRGDQWRKDSGPVAAPTASSLFDNQRYAGGSLVLYALRTLVGEDKFTRIERAYLDRYRNSNAATNDYITVASEVSGRDLSGFLNDWLYGTKTPRMPGHPDWTVTPPSTVATRREQRRSPKDLASATL